VTALAEQWEGEHWDVHPTWHFAGVAFYSTFKKFMRQYRLLARVLKAGIQLFDVLIETSLSTATRTI